MILGVYVLLIIFRYLLIGYLLGGGFMLFFCCLSIDYLIYYLVMSLLYGNLKIEWVLRYYLIYIGNY